jgi:hypothetical protein
VDGETAAVNPALTGTKCAAWSRFDIAPGEHAQLDLVLSAKPLERPFAQVEKTFSSRQSEATCSTTICCRMRPPTMRASCARPCRHDLGQAVLSLRRRALAGRRPDPAAGGAPPGPQPALAASEGRDVISMPDTWEYPWFAAWDLAYHCSALALVDVDFAKQQVELMLSDRYMHPNGQIPAYEWNFGDVNPPVHAMAAIKVFRAERVQRGEGDHGFLQRVFHKLLLNFSWWINRKDADGHNLFEGGFLGLDNISVYDRSKPLPPGYRLQAGRRHRLDGALLAQDDADRTGAVRQGPGLRGDRDPLLQAVPVHRRGHRRQRGDRRTVAVGPETSASSPTCCAPRTRARTASRSTPGSG